MSEPLNLPAEIDLIQQQIEEARDLETVREIHDRAEALRVYCSKHDGLLEAHNRLAGVIARCERRIGQELRTTPRQTGGDAMKARSGTTTEVPPTLAELGISKDESAAYQEMASVEETVILRHRDGRRRGRGPRRHLPHHRHRPALIDKEGATQADAPSMEERSCPRERKSGDDQQDTAAAGRQPAEGVRDSRRAALVREQGRQPLGAGMGVQWCQAGPRRGAEGVRAAGLRRRRRALAGDARRGGRAR
jgi:hypothetical protein